ncbi:IucA/IucC family C-terminal-domain containing protein [Calothrix sp. CCY 0018]|uniref:IucA/IucC family C-terminal-domain containing protein n=1 Tax=Calothrix sp. CCY 0018 TaxID=3103864 RepID=UPI0039C6DEE6
MKVQKLDNFYTDCIIFNLPPETEVVPVAEYLQPEKLLALFKATSFYQSSQNIRVAASICNKVYSWKTLPGVLALMTLAGVGLDASIDNVSFVLEDGQPKALWFHDLTQTVIFQERLPIPLPEDYPGKLVNNIEELHKFVFTGLFYNNINNAINIIHSITKLSKKTMWGNAVNASECLYEDFTKGTSLDVIKADYFVLFEQPYSSVMPNYNPLYKLIRTEKINEPGLPSEYTVRLTCCLYYLIPPHSEKCTNCPLLQPCVRIAQIKQDMSESEYNS